MTNVEDEISVKLANNPTLSTRPPHREATAASLGRIIVWTFALSIAAGFVIVIIEMFRPPPQNKPAVWPEVFKTVSVVMSAPLGFVLGFYFREERKANDDDNA